MNNSELTSKNQAPTVRLRIARDVVPEVLAAILANHQIEDVSVEDPPLEQVIAELFAQAGRASEQMAASG